MLRQPTWLRPAASPRATETGPYRFRVFPSLGAFARGALIPRVIQLLLTLLVASTTLFFLLRVSGDPVRLVLGEAATPEAIEAARHALGLDRPLIVQYGAFLWNLARLDLGESIRHRQPALAVVLERVPASAELCGAALAWAILVAIPLGIFTATRRSRWGQGLIGAGTLIGQSMPVFWLGVLLVLLFGVRLRLLPTFGYGGPRHLVLPAVTLGAFLMAKYTHLVRAGLLAILDSDYIRTARAKGLGEWAVYFSHALRNSLIPLAAAVGADASYLLGGAVITEIVFAWPGVGNLLVRSILSRDYPVVQSVIVVITFAAVLISLLVDLMHGLLDPRIRKEAT